VSNEHSTQNYDTEKHLIHPLMCKRHNDVTDVATQESSLKYEIKYDM